MFKPIVLSNKVGLRIRFRKYKTTFIFSRKNEPLFCFTPFFFYTSCHPRFTQNVNRFFHITFRKNKSFLTLAHSYASALAQHFNHNRSNFFHYNSSDSFSSSFVSEER